MTDVDGALTLTSSPELTTSSINETGNESVVDADDSSTFDTVLNQITVPILFGLISAVGLTGNGLVIYVILTKRRMRTVTNLLLLNLAIADLCFVLVIPPFTAYQYATSDWPFGGVVCKLLHYMVNVTAYVTVYTLVLIAALRYATVVHTNRTVSYRTRGNAVIAVCAIWVIMLALNIPILMSYGVKYEDDYIICDIHAREVGQRLFATFFAFGYVLPLSVIAIFSLCIVRHLALAQKSSSLTQGGRLKRQGKDKKRHAGRLLVLVVVLFALLWMPVHVHLLVAYFDKMPQSRIYLVVSVIFNCLAYFNSCVNPIIYNHASKEFRDAFSEVARCGRSATGDSSTGDGRNDGNTTIKYTRATKAMGVNTSTC